MSQANVKVVRQQFEGVNRRDWDAVMDVYAEEVVLVAHESIGPDAGIFTGRAAVGRWFGEWFSAFGIDYRFEVKEARAVGERVLAVALHRGTGRASGAEVELTTANLYTVSAGKIVRVELYASRAEALKAGGLAE